MSWVETGISKFNGRIVSRSGVRLTKSLAIVRGLFLDCCAGWVRAFLGALGLSNGGSKRGDGMAGKCPGGVGLVQEAS
jgi:hypothetical protein